MRPLYERLRRLARGSARAGSVMLRREPGLLWLIGALAIGGGTLALLLGPSDGPGGFAYSREVGEVMSDLDAHRGRDLRVEGSLEPGSLCYRESPCAWEWTMTDGEHRMKVVFPHCIVPDTLDDREAIRVTVSGRIRAKRVFVADEVIPRCPSKYELRERGAPHDYGPAPRRACGASAEDAHGAELGDGAGTGAEADHP